MQLDTIVVLALMVLFFGGIGLLIRYSNKQEQKNAGGPEQSLDRTAASPTEEKLPEIKPPVEKPLQPRPPSSRKKKRKVKT